MHVFNKKCPYSLRQIADIDSSREHVIPDALGGPNGLALNADAETNNKLGEGVDARLINSPLMAMSASRARVQTRSGPVTLKLQGELLADESPVDIRISEDGSTNFRSRVPVVKDRTTGEVVAVRGFGGAAQKQLEDLSTGHARKGRVVLAGEATTLDPTTHVSVGYNRVEVEQALAKIAYLTAVWTFGDAFLDTAAAGAFRALVLGPLASEPLANDGIAIRQDEPDEPPVLPPRDNEHHLHCAALDGVLFVRVSLFCSPLFTRKFLALLNLSGAARTSRLILVDATTKTFEERKDLLPS